MPRRRPRKDRRCPHDHLHPTATLVAFFGLAYAISWSYWIPLALSGAVVRQGSGSPTQLPGLLGPALAAIIVTAAIAGRPDLCAMAWAIVLTRLELRRRPGTSLPAVRLVGKM